MAVAANQANAPAWISFAASGSAMVATVEIQVVLLTVVAMAAEVLLAQIATAIAIAAIAAVAKER